MLLDRACLITHFGHLKPLNFWAPYFVARKLNKKADTFLG
jgi:hypothetical protein